MKKAKPDPIWKLMGVLFQSHPWHDDYSIRFADIVEVLTAELRG